MVTFTYGEVLTPGQWQNLFDGKQDALGYIPVNRAGDSMQGELITTPSTSVSAGFSIPPGVPPASPVDGWLWSTISGLFFRIGGTTIGPLGGGNVVGPLASVVGHIATFSTTGGTALADSGISLGSQAANLVLATPASGAGTPAFRGLVGADLPAPQASTLGGVMSGSAAIHQFAIGINTSGAMTFGQPAIGDISGFATNMAAFLVGGTSAQLAAAMTDATGTGPLVFANGPAIALGATSTAVTQSPGDNTTKPATTAYVVAAVSAAAAVTVFVGGTSTGTANAQVLATTTPNTFALAVGNRVVFPPGFTNTGPLTLAVNGLGAKNVYTPSASGPVSLVGGEVRAGQITEAIYDGTQFVLLSANPNASFGTLTNLASTSTTDLGTVPSHNVNITGTTAITSFGSSASVVLPVYMLTFAAALTLTYNATSMILPGGGNIITAAGDTAMALYLGSGNWQIIDYQASLYAPGVAPAWGSYKNLKVQVASDTTVNVTADELILEDTSGRTYRARTVSLTDTISTSGANGLDTGSAAASNWYSVWVIYNQLTNTVAALVSLSATAPTMPAGYTFKMRVGWIRYDAQPKLWRTLQYGRSVQIVLGINPLVTPIITSGAQGAYGAGSSPTLVSVSLANFVPSTAAKAYLGVTDNWKGQAQANILLAPSTAYGGTNNGPQGSNGQMYPVWCGAAFSQRAELVLEALSFGFASDAAGGAVGDGGWEDNL
ncbi:hypothetical protein [Mesorhizobium shangrilense]|uniref:Minor tail protein n=1 Tax=Mesorhizobium shangrilense TaxID=460060 RepID=A0ABV2DFV5_9HYPH